MAAIALAHITQVPANAGTLHDLEDRLDALANSAALVTPEQEQAFLVDFRIAMTTAIAKRDRVAARLAKLENQQEFAALEISRLQAFKAAKAADQARLEGYITHVIESLGKDDKGKYRRLEGNSSVLFLRTCPASVEVTDESAVPLDYKTATVRLPAALWNDVLNALDDGLRDTVLAATSRDLALTADKRAIKAAIEAKSEVPGARLITDKTNVGRK